MSGKFEDEENDPEVIAAKAAAQEKVLLARAQLHPVAQVLMTLIGGITDLLSNFSFVVFLGLVLLAIFAPHIFTWLIQLVF